MKKHIDCNGQRTIDPCKDHSEYDGDGLPPEDSCFCCWDIYADTPGPYTRSQLILPADQREVDAHTR